MKKLPYERAERVADEMHHIIATVFYTMLSDPRLKNVEITKVRMTKDLQIARVYFHMREKNEDLIRLAKKGLESAEGYLKRTIAQEMSLRSMPKFEFFYDEALDLQQKIEEIMEKKI